MIAIHNPIKFYMWLDTDYFNAGIERVRKAMMQESLFTPAPVVKVEQDKLFD